MISFSRLALRTAAMLHRSGTISHLAHMSSFNTIDKIVSSVTVSEDKAKFFLSGDPLIFDGAIANVTDGVQPSDEVMVKDHEGKVIGRGIYNPDSMYRVRMMALSKNKSFSLPLAEIVRYKTEEAIKRRISMKLPCKETNVYRLVNGEGDKLSGLMIDVLNNTVVVQSSARWVEDHAHLIRTALQGFVERNNMKLVWRRNMPRLKQDGYVPSLAGSADDAIVSDESRGDSGGGSSQVVVENGLRYRLNPETDQKTGFYCDQRENRHLLSTLCQGKTVLDAYCYTGGFTLNALSGGASHVTAVDSSSPAVDALGENIRLNGLPVDRVRLIEGDCEDVMKQLLLDENKTFDIVVCDPPKLAPTKQSLRSAVKKYTRINTLAMRLVRPEGGLLLSFSCSQAMTQSKHEFQNMLEAAARNAGRSISVQQVVTAGADHVVLKSFPKGKYLTGVLLKVT